jgi:uncharacterized phage protein (TIGR01671 family)
MREIKFRAWDAANEYMVYAVDEPVSRMDDTLNYLFTQFEEGDYGMIPEGEGERLPLMQFTGLKDKNFVEIYEGDIVKSWGWGILGWEVYWNEDHAQFCLTQGEEIQPTLKDFLRGDRSEVIGNIHENPELLEKY